MREPRSRQVTGICVFAAAMIAITGCAATTSDPIAEEQTATSQQAFFVPGACDPGTLAEKAERQRRATDAVRYVFGNDALAPPQNLRCLLLNRGLDMIREGLEDNSIELSRSNANEVCGLPAVIYRISAATPKLRQLMVLLSPPVVDACLGEGVHDFLARYDTEGDYIELDPESATLTATLGSSTGATAAAYYTNTPSVTTTAVKFGSSYAPCGTSATYAGNPCGTTALPEGSVVTYALVKTGSLCACR